MKVYIVLEGPDMTYYGDAEIHGVFANRADAAEKATEVDPQWFPGDEKARIEGKPGVSMSNVGVQEWDVEGDTT